MSGSDDETQDVGRIWRPKSRCLWLIPGSFALVLGICLPSTSVSGQSRSMVDTSSPHSDAHAPTSNLGTDLGPTRVPRISFPMLLHSSARPSCLQSWARKSGLAVSWSSGQQWTLLSGAPANIDLLGQPPSGHSRQRLRRGGRSGCDPLLRTSKSLCRAGIRSPSPTAPYRL